MTKTEFLEFLIRVAHSKFQNEAGWPPEEKVERTLGILFKAIGMAVAPIQQTAIEISSESDYESGE